MSLKRKYKFYQKVAFCLAWIMLFQAVVPTLSLALTSGPGSPEFSSFEPVATTSMVNEFSGGFTYNIPVLEVPGANGGGYACGLSYHSGESVESEASWVGYGWSLNPGAINRNKRGFADDMNAADVTYMNDVPANWTVSTSQNLGQIEAFSIDLPVSVSASLSYNNYRGFGFTASAGVNNGGIVSLGYSLSDGSGSFSVHTNPAKLLETAAKAEKLEDLKANVTAAKTIEEQKKAMEKLNKFIKNENLKSGALSFLNSMGSSYGLHSLGDGQRATSATPYDGQSFNMQVKMDEDILPMPIGIDLGMNANYTRQKNRRSNTLKTFGYMYSSQAQADIYKDAMMDYYVEKEDTYNKRDNYLSIPFSNADIYGLTGEGLGGGFRLYNKNTGTFSPNHVKSFTDIVQESAAVELGEDVGIGYDLGVGHQTLEVKRDWSDAISTSSNDNGNTNDYVFAAPENEGVFFRFNNDMGGSLTYTKSNAAAKANIVPQTEVPGIKTKKPDVSTTELYKSLTDTVENGDQRSGRSSYIAYHTNTEMGLQVNSLSYYAYEKSASTNDLVDRLLAPNGIGEFSVYNADGNRYVYGLPVYSRNETTMQYDLRGAKSGDIHHNYIAYKNISNPFSQVGEISNTPYATSYLLTEITSPDYLDRTMNGPSEDDFGGYTKFTYTKSYGNTRTSAHNTKGDWYKWRIPYTGLNYNPKDLTDNLDDMGSVNSGEKEVNYLQKIETKTHIAVFVTNATTVVIGTGTNTVNITGSGKARQDAVEAADDLSAAKDPTARGSKKLQLLERIELYAKPVDPSGVYTLIKTTHFDYDYSLCGNVPNNFGDDATNNNGEQINDPKGKLTLKKVWFEYEGIHNVKISPYKFDYAYPVITPSSGAITAYNTSTNKDILDYANTTGHNLTPYLHDTMQNPHYSPFSLDRWGSMRPDGQTKQENLVSWVDQTPSAFDPAAWQLKKITLPSGGELLVQYEQNEYRYVQDRRALSMVSLKRDPSLGDDPENIVKKNRFYLNVEDDLGITSLADKQELVRIIRDEFKDKKIFFKCLYALVGINPELRNCYSDYVDGYVNVKDVAIDGAYGNSIYLKLGDGNPFNGNSYELPRNVCIDYVKHEKGGKLKPANNCDASDNGVDDKNGPLSVAQQLIARLATDFLPQATCLDMKESLSYLRIPLLKAKKGGGIRVKRILMHDKGIETGDESIYGSEYFYTDVDGQSSGVATNEPTTGREENALITYLKKRDGQGLLNKAAAGKDKAQAEGPLGEYLLPAPSVGYSRVVVKNIHSGKTNTGFVVNEFYTAKDYPFDKSNYATDEVKGGAIAHTSIQEAKDWLAIPAPYFQTSINNLWLSQGYSFVINEMHGQQKSVATYGGEYTATQEPVTTMLSSKQEFTYFEPGEKIPLMVNANGTISYGNPGKETEVVMERRAVEDICKNGKVEVDISIGLIAPLFPIYVTPSGSASYTESKMRSHVTTKIIRYPAIQKSVTSYQDGIYHLSENIAFSASTGKPVLTKTADGYDKLSLLKPATTPKHNGSYYTYEIPASSQYKEMGQKATNERKILTSITGGLTLSLIQQGTDYFLKFEVPSGSSVCNAMNSFVRGDLIKVDDGISGHNPQLFHTDEKQGSSIKLFPTTVYNTSITTGSVASVEIIRSGKTNQLSTNAGGYTTYGAKQTVTTTNPTDDAVFAARKSIATALNTALAGESTSINFNTYLGSLSSDIRNKMKFNYGLLCDGSQKDSGCRDLVTDNTAHPFSIDYSLPNNQFALKFQDLPSRTVYDPIPSTDITGTAQLATDLNYWINQVMTFDKLEYANHGYLFNTDHRLNNPYKNKTQFEFEYTGENDRLVFPSITVGSFMADRSANGGYGTNKIGFLEQGALIQKERPEAKIYRYVSDWRPGTWGVYFRHCGDDTPVASFKVVYDVNLSNIYLKVPDLTILLSDNTYVSEGVKNGINFYASNKTWHFGSFSADKGDLYYTGAGGTTTKVIGSCPLTSHTAAATYYCEKFTKGGHFDVDSTNGKLVYYDPTNMCYPQSVIMNFCDDAPNKLDYRTINKVVACNAATFTDSWQLAPGMYIMGTVTGNAYETGVKGKWRMASSYAYNDTIKAGSRGNERNYYDAGTYPMTLFNWQSEGANDAKKWIRATTVTKYSPNGEAIEENDVLNVKSAAKYGYKGMLPYLIAKNADYSSVQFESFENVYTNGRLEETTIVSPSTIDNAMAHSGKSSLKLKSTSLYNFAPVTVTSQVKSKGLKIRFWGKTTVAAQSISANYSGLFSGANPPAASRTVSFVKIAQTGMWTLYEANIPLSDFASPSLTINIKSTGDIWMDDVRLQPMDAQVMAYVYDGTNKRLLTSFDDQHFGLYYQYNEEGKLVRKQVETERGLKTIQETQYHTPLQNR